MATSETADRTAVSGVRLSTQEEPAEEHLVQTPDRRHVNDLLDISEEDFLKELEPHENLSYCGWDEAVSTNLSANYLAYIWLWHFNDLLFTLRSSQRINCVKILFFGLTSSVIFQTGPRLGQSCSPEQHIFVSQEEQEPNI